MADSSELAPLLDLLDQALDLPPPDRAAWLADLRRTQPAQAARLEAMLATEVELDRAGFLTELPEVPEPTASPRRIGPYRVLRELGRGGMGVVYLAERDDGQYRHRVAVKVLRGSPDADETHRRFLAERQILASLSHPNVAQLLDGGVSDGQLPYLVMEYVDGLPITDYCDRHRLTVDARLRLFQDVCAAVHHAHQNLVLHRDLKPSNVLVTRSGDPKLLDFGIAKLLNPSLSGLEQPVTRTAFRLMTPAYASPEQVRGDSLTTASDVYTLGLLLYEMLAGRPAHRITTDSPREVFQVVCEREPERPSVGVAGDDVVAAARDTTPEKLSRRLRGDLDAIVALALRKEPGRRYGSAELFATDIGRYLDGMPVVAHRGNRWYRFEKMLLRHRAAATFAAAGALVLVTGAGLALRLASVAAHERDRAAMALDETQRALGESEEVTAFLEGLFEASDPAEGRVDRLSAADLLRRGGARAERLGDAPLAQARMFEALGRVHASRGDLPLAADYLARALGLRRTHLGASHPATATTGAQLANVVRRQGHYAAADTLAREALLVRRSALGDSHPDVAASLGQVSGLAIYLGDLAAAEQYAREAIAVRRRAGYENDSTMVSDVERLASVLWRRGDHAGAERALREALAAGRVAFAGPNLRRANTLLRLADVLDERPTGRAAAESLYYAAVSETRAAVGDSHPGTADAMSQLGLMLARHGRTADGERIVREALELQRRIWGPSHTVVAGTLNQLALLRTVRGDLPEAEQLAREALAIYEASLGATHATYAGALGFLGEVVAQRGALDSAEALHRRAVAIRAASVGPEHPLTALSVVPLATVMTQQRRFTEADSLYRWALRLLRDQTIETNRDIRRTYAGLAMLYEAWGKRDSAAIYRQRAGSSDLRLR